MPDAPRLTEPPLTFEEVGEAARNTLTHEDGQLIMAQNNQLRAELQSILASADVSEWHYGYGVGGRCKRPLITETRLDRIRALVWNAS